MSCILIHQLEILRTFLADDIHCDELQAVQHTEKYGWKGLWWNRRHVLDPLAIFAVVFVVIIIIVFVSFTAAVAAILEIRWVRFVFGCTQVTKMEIDSDTRCPTEVEHSTADGWNQLHFNNFDWRKICENTLFLYVRACVCAIFKLNFYSIVFSARDSKWFPTNFNCRQNNITRGEENIKWFLGFVFTKKEKEDKEGNAVTQDRYSRDNFVD